jgi:hypothetical protein
MTYRALLLAGLALAGSGVPAYAQEAGVKAGIALSNVNIREPMLLPIELQWCCSPWDGPRVDLTGGVYLTVPLTRDFTGRTEVLFTRRGFSIAETAEAPGSALRLTYFEIPVLMQVGVRPVYLIGGGSLSLGVASDARTTIDGVSRPGTFAKEDNVSSFDVGLVMGAGASRGRGFIEARYTHGLRNVLRESPSGSSLKNKAFLIMVGARVWQVR